MPTPPNPVQRCAIYTRKSTDDRMDIEVNSLEHQREVCSAYIKSQRHRGWTELSARYDDAAQSGGTLDRPALLKLMEDVEAGRIDVIVIYKIDRLSRSLTDFVKLVDVLDRQGVGFVSITQAFDTSDSMGRLVPNILLTFAQFEREMIADRIRDKVATLKRRGKWTGGRPPFGYRLDEGKLVVEPEEAALVRMIFERFLALGSYVRLKAEIQARGITRPPRVTRKGKIDGGKVFSNGMIYSMLECRYYLGETPHYDRVYAGEHDAIIDRDVWDRAQALRAERAMYKLNQGPSPNLLLGFIVDSFGRRMTIADDSTKGRRYRYYISNQARWAAREGLQRVRAEADGLESIVLASLREMLASRDRLRAVLTPTGLENAVLDSLAPKSTEAARRCAAAVLPQKRRILTALVRRLEVAPDQLTLVLRCHEVARFVAWNGRGIFRAAGTPSGASEPTFVVTVPVRAVRFRRALVIPVEPRDPSACEPPSRGLVTLIAEARRGQAAIDANRHLTVREIAAQFRRTPGFFARIVRLNYLAPDIVTAIQDGRHPPGLTRKALVMADLPMDWALQRRLLGFRDRVDLASEGSVSPEVSLCETC